MDIIIANRGRVGAYQRNAIPTFDPILVKGLVSKEDLFDFVVTKCKFS
jgi:hypothetical protein